MPHPPRWTAACLRDVWPPRVGDIYAEGCTARSFDSSVLITAVRAPVRAEGCTARSFDSSVLIAAVRAPAHARPVEDWCSVDIIAVRHVRTRADILAGRLSDIEVLRGISITYSAAWLLLHRMHRVGDEALC